MNVPKHLPSTASSSGPTVSSRVASDVTKIPAPMLASLVASPFDDDAWAFEPKWDGVRAAGVITADEVRFISRNGNDISVAYPELASAANALKAKSAILDGEICAFDDGKPSFQKLQMRMHVRAPGEIERLSKAIPVAYIVFDILALDGKSLLKMPYRERREILERTLEPSKTVRLSPVVYGDGTALFEAARQQHLEGIVAKKLEAPYEPGRRSRFWLKVKTIYDADVVVAGWRHGGTIVSAVFDDGKLRYTGGVGTGYTQRTLAELRERYAELATDEPNFPTSRGFEDVHWIRPELVAIVEFRELTSDFKLRQPAFKGLRDDKSPVECTLEELKKAAGLTT
jgi:bifunctional non-homologous end joining protein LigD